MEKRKLPQNFFKFCYFCLDRFSILIQFLFFITISFWGFFVCSLHVFKAKFFSHFIYSLLWEMWLFLVHVKISFQDDHLHEKTGTETMQMCQSRIKIENAMLFIKFIKKSTFHLLLLPPHVHPLATLAEQMLHQQRLPLGK